MPMMMAGPAVRWLLLLPGLAAALTCRDPALKPLKFCDKTLPVATRAAHANSGGPLCVAGDSLFY
jgi:hypothetical protein